MNKGILLDSTKCIFCNEQPENGDHLFALCKKTMEVRRSVNRWWSVLKENCSSSHEVFGTIKSPNHSNWDQIIQDAIIQAYTWVVWNGRNNEIFKGATFNPLRASNDIQSLVYSWVCSRSKLGKNLSWYDWCCNPRSCISRPL